MERLLTTFRPLTIPSIILTIPVATRPNLIEGVYLVMFNILFQYITYFTPKPYNPVILYRGDNFIATMSRAIFQHVNPLVFTLLVLMNIQKRKKLYTILQNIQKHIDEVLETRCELLVHSQRQTLVQVSAFLTTTVLIVILFHVAHENVTLASLVLVVLFVPNVATTLLWLQFCTYLMVVKERFYFLNRVFVKLVGDDDGRVDVGNFVIQDTQIKIKPKQNKNDIYKHIDQIFDLHQRLCGYSREINSMYGMQLVVTMFTTLILLLGEIYTMYDLIFEKNNHKPGYVWHLILAGFSVLLDTIRFIFISYWAKETVTAGDEFKYHLQRVRKEDVGVQERTEPHIVLLEQCKLKFTGADFFAIDYTLLYSIVAAVTTYLVVAIQIDLSQKQHKNAKIVN